MKSWFRRIAVTAVLLGGSATAWAASSDCCVSVECCLRMLECCFG